MKRTLVLLVIFLSSCGHAFEHYDINDYKGGYIMKKTRMLNVNKNGFSSSYDEYIIRIHTMITTVKLDTMYNSIYKQFDTIR